MEVYVCVSRLLTDVLNRKDANLDSTLVQSIINKYYTSDASHNSHAYKNLISDSPIAKFYLPRYSSYNARLSTNDVSARPFNQFWKAVSRFKRIEYNLEERNYIVSNYVAKDVFDFTTCMDDVAITKKVKL